MGCSVLHALAGFGIAKLLLVNNEIAAHAVAYRLRNFALECEDVLQKGFNAVVHWAAHLAAFTRGDGARSCPRIAPFAELVVVGRTSIADEMREGASAAGAWRVIDRPIAKYQRASFAFLPVSSLSHFRGGFSKRISLQVIDFIGDPGRIRTCDLQLRR